MKRSSRRLLPAVIGLDAVARELERVERLRLAGALGGVDFGRADAQADFTEIDAIELLRSAAISARSPCVFHLGDDGAHGLLDVLRGLALALEEIAESRREIGGLAVETKGHDLRTNRSLNQNST